NDAVNACWMCDAGRLNYKWIGRPDRLTRVQGPMARVEGLASQVQSSKSKVQGQATTWSAVLKEISELLTKAPVRSVALVASARLTNEELFLLSKLKAKLGALSDSIPRLGEGDKFLVNADKNPNSNGARLTGIAATPIGSNLSKIADGIRSGTIKTLIVFGEDVTQHGIGAELLAKLESLIVCDILPNKTTELAHYLLPGAAHAEKRGTFTNVKGRVQRFMKAVEPPGDARPEWEFLHEWVFNVTGQNGFATIEGLFNQMANEVPAFNGLTWANLGDTGVAIQI
ncbi:MAG: molybdopterin-dependent oxidoreductase, partial [Verrucomicrobiota bacterium]